MNMKVLFGLIIVLMVAIFGYSQYSSAKHEEQLAAMKAESAKVQAETARLEAEQNREKQEKLNAQAAAEQMRQKLSAENDKTDKAAKAKLQDIANRWQETNTRASSTGRIALSPVVKDLQTIKHEAEGVEVGQCTKPAKEALIGGMQYIEDGYLRFMADTVNGEGDAIELRQKAAPLFAEYSNSIESCKV